MPIIVVAIYIVTTIIARPFIDKIRGIIQVIMLGFFNIMMFGITIIYLNFEPFDGWAVAVAAIVVRCHLSSRPHESFSYKPQMDRLYM